MLRRLDVRRYDVLYQRYQQTANQWESQMALTIKTDHKWRNLSYRNEVPESVLKDQFDYLSEDDSADGFFEYRGHWYHTSYFFQAEGCDEFGDWHGYASDSYFSGVVIKLSDDGEQVMCGTYFS